MLIACEDTNNGREITEIEIPTSEIKSPSQLIQQITQLPCFFFAEIIL